MITLGVGGISYPELKNIVSLPFEDVRVLRTYSVTSLPNFFARHIFKKSGAHSFLNCFSWDMGLTKVDLFHFFNRISAPPRPWMVTFEHEVPRWNARSRMGMRLLAGNSCGKVIALSDFAYDAQRQLLEEFPDLRDDIAAKMITLHPPQPVLIPDVAAKNLDPDRLSLVFIGRDFFREGGANVLSVFSRLIQEGHAVHLVIISAMNHGDYVTNASAADVHDALRVIRSLEHHITLRSEIADLHVADYLRDAHIGLLPTYDDTFGYSVLECQAAGTPVISTDVCALPEINNNDIGWLIRVPQGIDRRALFRTADERARLSRIIEEQLYETIKRIIADPAVIRNKATLAWERIRDHYAPEQRAAFLTSLYRDVLTHARAKR